MRFVSFEHLERGTHSWGLQLDDMVMDVQTASGGLSIKFPPCLLDFLREGPSSWSRANVAFAALRARRGEGILTAEEVRLLAPIPRPPKNVFALGLNYAEHVAEAGKAVPLPEVPIYFSKAATAVIEPAAPIIADPKVTNKLDSEVELGVVIGRGGRRISKEQIIDHVFGYTVINDISARDIQLERPEGQWFLGKSVDGFCPMGPALVSTDEISTPQGLSISLRVNGVEKQRSNTRFMIFDVAAIIADLSRYVTLEPGDVISTGTPGGVGHARMPAEYLQPGDVVEAEIETIGILRNPITRSTT